MVVIGRIFRLDAAHHLPCVEPEHPCSKMHGHTYEIQVLVDGPVLENGMVMDYHDMDRVIKPVIRMLDHTVLNDIIENPTAENICRWLFNQLMNELPLAGIQVNETQNSFARYSYSDYLLELEELANQTESESDNGEEI